MNHSKYQIYYRLDKGVKLVEKMTSGRFILTVITGVVFGYMAVTGKITGEASAAIIATVFTAYFNRNDRGGKSV